MNEEEEDQNLQGYEKITSRQSPIDS